ncbi:MAG: hypothetical protein IKX57_02815 [Oscillospiraceae bacterium]|nr:hypothetical protein [Oscillospiraceae bacterium]
MPKSFCSGKVVFQDVYDYSLEDVIFLLENREFSEFRFNSGKGYALIDSEAGEILIEHKGSDNVIPEETVRRMLDVLEHIEECIEKANDWIINLDQKDDKAFPADQKKWIPDLKEIFEVKGINFGDLKSHFNRFSILVWNQYRCGSHHPKYASDSFSIEFYVDYIFFNVKFDYKDMLPYEIELRIVKNT